MSGGAEERVIDDREKTSGIWSRNDASETSGQGSGRKSVMHAILLLADGLCDKSLSLTDLLDRAVAALNESCGQSLEIRLNSGNGRTQLANGIRVGSVSVPITNATNGALEVWQTGLGQGDGLEAEYSLACEVCAKLLTEAREIRERDAAMRATFEEIERIGASVAKGDLDARGDVSRFSGESAIIIQGLNGMLEASIVPLRMTARYVREIAHGKIPPFIIDEYQGEFDETKKNLNTFLAVMHGLTHETRGLVECIKRGNLTARGNDWDFEGHWRELIAGVNEVIDSFVSPFQVAAGNVHRIARGEIPGPITDRYHGDFNDIKKSVNLLIKELSSFIKEMSLLQDSHRIGEIDARMPEEQFQGVFRGMAEGVNHGMGMHISNQMKLLDVVTTYAKGDFSKTLQKLPGKQAVANDAVDLLRGNLQGVVRELATLTSAAVEGRLSVRADASQYQGDWKALIQGINGTLEAVVTPLQVAAESVDRISKGDIPPLITDEYRGDFNEIKININRCIQAIRALIEDSTRLSEGAIQGKLSTRIDANRHLGEFRAIMQGVNATLDAVIHPIDESRTVLEKLAGYDLRERVTSEFNGDHARIKDAVNATAEALHDAMAQVAAGAEQLSQAGARIAASSEQVATATADQARGLEKTAERLQKLQSMTQTNAEGTRTAKIVAQRAQEAADRGKVAMVEMAQAMEEIRVSSASTAQIIKDINEIAFQTNLLALNAAVEAARAGDAGQGFAVVASEVRNLAVRSKEAAKTTEKLIERAVKLADNGEYLSKGVAQNLSQITEAVNEVGKIVDEIATASQKQEKGMSIVGKTVTQLAEMTQSNADSAKESSEAAEELASQTDELSSLVARFELNSQQVQVSEEDSL